MSVTNGVCTLDASGNYTCGTGGWVGPKPGDPSTSDVYLTATPAYGGIDINITWPQLNPSAVSYVMLYRSLLPDPDTAVVHSQFQGTFYYDPIGNGDSNVYYYWVKIMSIYGTLSELLGPAWARSKPRIEQMIEELTGKIDSGVLSQELKKEMDQIQLNKLGITQEMIDRAANDDALGIRVNEVEAHSGTTRALLQEEVLARTSENEAFVSTVNTLYADLNGQIAAVQTTTTAQVNALGNRVDALASQITQVETNVNGNIAQVQTQLQTQINTVDGKVTNIGALYTAKVNVNGLIGGFGVYNDGTEVEAGFDVDRFWIGRTSAQKRKPFIIDAGVVYIDEGAINKLTFNKLRDESGAFVVQNGKVQAKYIQADQLVVNQAYSTNYVGGTSGWYLGANGTYEFNSVDGSGGRMRIVNGNIYTYYPSGRLATAMGPSV